MTNTLNTFHQEQKERIPVHSAGLDPVVILSLLIKNWYYFLFSLIIALLLARFYLGHTMPVFLSSTTIQINETGERQLINNDEIMLGLGLPGGMRNLENQISVIKSRPVTERALKQLPFEITYYYKTIKNEIPIYPDIPIKLIYDNEANFPKDIEFSVSYLGRNSFILESESGNLEFKKTASFGDTIEIGGGRFYIDCRNEAMMNNYIEQKLYFVFHSRNSLIRSYNSRLNVELLSRGSSILVLSIMGTNRNKDVDFLNKVAEVYQAISLDKKNAEAQRRIQFIDDQLVGISDSLMTTENKLQQFRSTYRVMDLSAQGQAIIGQVTLLENERARLRLEANYYDYLAEYLAKDVTREVPIVPITMGITDPGLTGLVTDLAEMQQQLASAGAGERNPMQGLLSQRIRSTKESLIETLNGLRRANSLARSENEEQIQRVNRQASDLPVTERQLLGIERQFRLNDELYTFLLETRANIQMQKASNTPDSEVIEDADVSESMIVSPSPVKTYFIGLFGGFAIPFLVLYLNFLFNKRLKEEDIRKFTDIPVAGNIPHNGEKIFKVVFDNPNSSIAESYRLLRSRMQFFTKDAASPVLLITSSMPGEGKTFTAINLASAYSLLGKKTVLVGFDLRKPILHETFDLNNEKGVSTWLIGKDRFEDIIQKTAYENLSVLPSGPVPPNPSELTSLDKTGELLQLLKESYDYIVLDSSPIGIVSDTFHLASLSDACLLVVRPGMTLKDILAATIREIRASGIKGLTMIINDIQTDGMHYAYGEKFGYTSEKEKSKRFKFFRKKSRNQKMKS